MVRKISYKNGPNKGFKLINLNSLQVSLNCCICYDNCINNFNYVLKLPIKASKKKISLKCVVRLFVKNKKQISQTDLRKGKKKQMLCHLQYINLRYCKVKLKHYSCRISSLNHHHMYMDSDCSLTKVSYKQTQKINNYIPCIVEDNQLPQQGCNVVSQNKSHPFQEIHKNYCVIDEFKNNNRDVESAILRQYIGLLKEYVIEELGGYESISYFSNCKPLLTTIEEESFEEISDKLCEKLTLSIDKTFMNSVKAMDSLQTHLKFQPQYNLESVKKKIENKTNNFVIFPCGSISLPKNEILLNIHSDGPKLTGGMNVETVSRMLNKPSYILEKKGFDEPLYVDVPNFSLNTVLKNSTYSTAVILQKIGQYFVANRRKWEEQIKVQALNMEPEINHIHFSNGIFFYSGIDQCQDSCQDYGVLFSPDLSDAIYYQTTNPIILAGIILSKNALVKKLVKQIKNPNKEIKGQNTKHVLDKLYINTPLLHSRDKIENYIWCNTSLQFQLIDNAFFALNNNCRKAIRPNMENETNFEVNGIKFCKLNVLS